MEIFKNYTYTWWQIALLKFAMLFIGIAIGAYWYDVFVPYTAHFFGVGVILGVYLAYISFRV